MTKSSQTKKIPVQKEFEGLRLDVFLKKWTDSRSSALKLILEKQVCLNNRPLKASYRLRAGDQLRVTFPPKKTLNLKPWDFPLKILFEDKELLVVNKPAGLVVHPAPGHEEKTLVNILFHKKKLSPGSRALRPGIVHRLDKDVSGLLVLTKTKSAQDFMIQQFKERNIQREYWALCLRGPSPVEGEIKSRIARHPSNRKKFISLKQNQDKGKFALTFYKLFCQHESGLSWLKCWLKTGRTHQIRLHLNSISCPVVGDKTYGGQKLSFIKDLRLKEQVKKLQRIALHAHSLSFPHPVSKKQIIFKSPWPPDMKALLNYLHF